MSDRGRRGPALAAALLALVAAPAAASESGVRPLGNAPPAVEALRGKVAVLNYWATWCVPCVKELPDLVEVSRRFDSDEVVVIAVAAEPVSEAERVERFLRERGVELPAWIGADADDMGRFGLDGTLPATVVLDREGKAVFRIQGTFEREALEARVREALSGAPEADRPVARGGSRVPS